MCVRREKTASVRLGCSANKKCAVCIAVAADGTKLRILAIFKAAENGPVANSLHSIMPPGPYACIQVKGWMDNRVIQD